MSELFPDTRARIAKSRKQVDEGLPPWNWHVYSLEDSERLLSALDALMEVARAAAYIAPSYPDPHYDSPGTLTLIEKLDALPPEIKEALEVKELA